MKCEKCGAELPTGRNGTPRYRSVMMLRGDLPPVSRKYCLACWGEAMTPQAAQKEHAQTVEGLPLFAEVTP